MRVLKVEKVHLLDKPGSDDQRADKSISAPKLVDEVWSPPTNVLHSACKPNYRWTDTLRPTEKMLQFEELALEALNSSVTSQLQAPTVQEQQLGTALSERAMQLDGNNSKTYPEVQGELAKVHDLFAASDLQSTQRIITEANRILEPRHKKIAISKTGEIWLGHQNFSSEQYSLAMPLKQAECDVS